MANLLVDWLNNKATPKLKKALNNVQTVINNNTGSNMKNITTPTIYDKTSGINLKKAAQPVQPTTQPTTQPTVQQTAQPTIIQTQPVAQPTITTNNPFLTKEFVENNYVQSRFIGFQQPQVSNTTLNRTENEKRGHSWDRLMNGGYAYVESDVSKAETANYEEDQRYRTAEQVIKDFSWDVKNSNGKLTKNDISKYYKEWKGKEDAALQLQADILPLVQQGQFPDMSWVSQTYGELLKNKELKDIEAIKKKTEMSNESLQNMFKNADNALKSNWDSFSANGIKFLQDITTLKRVLYGVKEQGVVGGGSDYEILSKIIENDPEIQKIVKEMNSLELSELDKAKLGRSDANNILRDGSALVSLLSDKLGLKDEFNATDEELETGIRAKEKLEEDFGNQTWKKIATEVGVPLDTFEKKLYKAYKDAQNLGTKAGAWYYGRKGKEYWENELGVELTDEQYNEMLQNIGKIEQELTSQNKQNVLDYQESVNKEYENKKVKNLDADIEAFYNGDRSMTSMLLNGDFKGFAYKSAGEAAQNSDMLVTTALGVVAPETVLPLMLVDSYARESQESFEELMEVQKKMGIPQDIAYDNATIDSRVVGISAALVEVYLEKLLGGVETSTATALHDMMMKDFTEKTTKMVAERGIGSLLGQGLYTQARASLEEGFEEVAQQRIHNKSIQRYDPDQKLTEGMLQAFEGGFYNWMNLMAGGADLTANVSANREALNQGAYNAGVMAREFVDNANYSLNKGAFNVGAFLGNMSETLKNKMTTSQGGTNNIQQQGQGVAVNTTSENQNNNINGDNDTESGWSQPKKGIVSKGLSGIGKAYDSTIGKGINYVAEKGAEVITDTSSPQDKLFQAVNPSLNRLTNKRGNYEQKRKNADRTNELIIEYGYKPENSADYYSSLIKTKNALWKNEIQRGLDAHKYTTVKSTELTNAVRDAMQEDAKFPLETNKSDLNKLNKELERLDKEGELTLEQLESLKQQINQKLNYGKNAEAGEIYEKGLRAMNSKISEIEDQLIAKLPGEFTKFKKDYGALKDMEDDVLKMMLKDMKKKDGGGLTQNIGRIAGLGKLLTSPLEGTMQIIFGEVVGKAKETNFLIQKGFEDLSNQYNGTKKTLDVKENPNQDNTDNTDTTPPTNPTIPTPPTNNGGGNTVTNEPKNKITKKKPTKKNKVTEKGKSTTPIDTQNDVGGNGTSSSSSITKIIEIARDNLLKIDEGGSPYYNIGNRTVTLNPKKNHRFSGFRFPAKQEYLNFNEKLKDVREGNQKKTTLSTIPEPLSSDNKARGLIIDTEMYEKNSVAHGVIDAINLLTTANEYEYAVKMGDTDNHINLYKKIPGTDDYFVIGADISRYNGEEYYTLTFHEPTRGLTKALESDKAKGKAIYERQSDGNFKLTTPVKEEKKPKTKGGQPKNTVTSKKSAVTTPKAEEKSDSDHFSYDEYGKLYDKIEAAQKEINDRLDKQYEQERAEKMSRFEELRDKEDKTDAEGKELVKLQGELNNMSNKYDKLKEDELKKQAPELLQQKEELQQAFDRDWKAAMDKKMEEMEKPFNDLRDEFRQKLRDELGIADDVILDEKYYNSLTPAQKETADRINKEFADRYEELRKRVAGEEIIPEIKKAVEKKQEKPKKNQTKKEEKDARARGLAKPDGNLIYSSGERKYVPSLQEGLIRLTKEEGQKKFKEQLGNAFRGGLEITVREDNESPYYDADRFFVYNPDREGIEEWEDRDIEELTINGDNIKEFEVSNDGDVDIIIDDPYIEGKDREIILDLKDFLNYSNMTRYIGKAHPRNLLGGSKNKVTSSAPIDTFEDLDFWTIKELKDRGDQAAIDLYEEMGIEDDALEELYKEMLIEENETPQRPSIFDEELETERQLSENETAQTPTIFEEDLEQMNLRELDENETPQINEEEIENSINSKKETVTPEYQEILDKMPDDGRNYFIYIKVGDKYYIEGNPKGRMVYATMYKKENVAKMLPKLDEHIEAGSDYQIRDYNGNVYYQSTGTWQKSEEQLAKERAEDEAKAEAQKPAYEKDEKYSQIKDFIEGIDNKAQKTKAANKLLERTRWQLDDGKIVNRTKAEFLEYLVKEQGKTPKEFPTGKTYPNGEPKVEYMIVNDKNIGYKSSKIENDYARSLLETPEEEISAEDEAKLDELFTPKTTTEVTGEKNAVTAKEAESEKPKNLVTNRIENTKQEIQEIDKDTYFDDIVKNLKDHPREMFIYKDGRYFYPHYILPSGKVLTPENTYWGEVSSEEAARNWLLKEAEEHSEENETKKAGKLKEIVGKTAEKYEATLKRIESDNPMQEIWTSGDYFKYGMGNNQMARAKKESEANAEVGTFKKDVIDGKEGYRIFVAGTKNEAIRAFYEPKTGKTYRIYRGPIIDDSKPYTTKQVERIEKFLQNVDKQLDKETKKEKKEEKQVITQERLDSLKPDKDGVIELDYKGDERWALGKGKEALIKEGKADGKYLYNYGGAAHPQYMALYIKNGIVYEGRKGLEDQYMTTKQEAVDWLNQKEKDVEHESTERYTQTDYETLPKTISVETEADKAGPKRIAPDRVKRQQETYDQGLESVKNVLKQSPVKIYELGFKSDRSKAVQNILEERKRIRQLPETEAEKQWNELAKSVYEDLVIKDISKGYRYPEDVTSKFPKAQMQKAIDARARYEKGLFTSFSAKDTRANNQYREEIGAGIKSQDGKPVTQEQMNEIVDGIRAYSNIFGVDMKKFAEDNNVIYVHLHGGNPFLMGGMSIAGLYRRDAAGNISVSLGGREGVMEKGEDGKMKKSDIKTTTVHEITHAVDGMLEGKLFSDADTEILKKTMNKPSELINYYNRKQEIVARAVEQYAAHQLGKKLYRTALANIDWENGSVEFVEKEANYVDREAYWNQENFDKYVKPIVEKNMNEKMKDYKIEQPKNNITATDKNRVTNG